jgi:hypothetical protein
MISAAAGLIGAKVGASTTLTVADRTAKAAREADDARWRRDKLEVIYERILTDVLAYQYTRRKIVERLENNEIVATPRAPLPELVPPDREGVMKSEVNIIVYGEPAVLACITALKHAERRVAAELQRWNRVAFMPPTLAPMFVGMRKSAIASEARAAIADADAAVNALRDEITR